MSIKRDDLARNVDDVIQSHFLEYVACERKRISGCRFSLHILIRVI